MPMAKGRKIVVVGKGGRLFLGKRLAGTTFRVEQPEDGTIVMMPAATVPASQLWTLDEPHRSQIEQGLAWAAATEPRETKIDGLLKRRAARARRRRVQSR